MWMFGVALAMALVTFKDVPETHWAKASVDRIAARGYMSGFPDQTFRGDRPVTRFEFAVALDRFVQDVEKGLKEAPKSPKAKEKTVGVAESHWAHDSLRRLLDKGYLPPESPIFDPKTKELTAKQLGEALGQIATAIAKLFAVPLEDEEVPPPPKPIPSPH